MARHPRSNSSLGTGLAIAGLVMIIAVSFAIPFIPTAKAATVDVDISGFAFNPQTININVGDTVRWTNSDTATHTVASNTGAWTTLTLAFGAQGSVPFNTQGTFGYHCSIHPSMTGTVNVGTVVPEFSSGLFVVVGLMAMMLGLMVVRRRRT